jgi:penicillin-insensitive murein DD-endopeptidase
MQGSMGFRRWLTVLTGLTVAGVALARPEVVPAASRFMAPLFAQQKAVPVEGAHQLPDYIPGAHELTFSSDASPQVVADAAPAQTAAVVPAGAVEANRDAPQSIPANPLPTTTAAIAPSSITPIAQAAEKLPEQPARPAAATVAAIDPLAPEDGSKSEQTITVEPDPTLPANRAPLVAAKTLFGAAKLPAKLASQSIGSYARGCLAGGVALPSDGPAWQAMRPSRNRNWGHPRVISLVERLANDSQKLDGWPGLLVGDISQPRGGPMLTGHASHQVGLDADVWLTPMPDHKLSRKEREEINATSMLDSTDLAVDKKIFNEGHVKLIKRAASYPEVERVLVHPAIKKALCEAAGTDRKWLDKVRPIAGHYYHFHIRIGCPPGSANCAPQKPPPGDDGCGKEVQEWLARVAPSKGPPLPKPPGYKPPPPKPPITLATLPPECTAVLESGPDGVAVPADAKATLKAIARAPVSLRAHLRKLSAAGK